MAGSTKFTNVVIMSHASKHIFLFKPSIGVVSFLDKKGDIYVSCGLYGLAYYFEHNRAHRFCTKIQQLVSAKLVLTF